MAEYPKVSVIIPMYNAAKTAKNCIRSILASDYPDFEVIVVDDASTDNSASAISDLPFKKLVLDKNSGPGVARNRGVESASGEIIAFTDADCEVPRDWLRKIANDFKIHDIGATSGGYSRPINNGSVVLFQFYDTCFRQRDVPRYIKSCITSNFACKKEVFRETGGFPSQRINEDMEFGVSLSRKYRILWNRTNGIGHYFNNSLPHYFAEQIEWSESVARSYLSNPVTISGNNTWRNAEIFSHLVFTSLLYLSLGAIFWDLRSIFISPGIAALYLAINVKFIKFIAKREGYVFAFQIFPLLLIRNTAWLLGIVRAVFKYPIVMLSKAIQGNKQ
jgi:glycosyltransferase involved in cell wall biosynthesis